MAGQLKPWARFKLVSKDPAEESDHLYFFKSETRVGRNARADVVLDMLFISGMHCVLKLEGFHESGDPIVKLQRLSRNDIYVNEEPVDKVEPTQLEPNDTIHFTKPGVVARGIPPTVFRYELLRDGLTPENNRLRAERDASSARPPTARGVAAPTTSTPTPTTPTPTKGSGVVTTLPLTGKRQRRSDDVQILEEMEVEVTRNLAESSSGVKRRRTAERVVSDDEDLTTSQQLHNSNKNLREKLEKASEREAQLKVKISQLERSSDGLKDQLQVLEESKQLAENEAALKGERLADREAEIEELKKAMVMMQSKVEEMAKEVTTAKSNEANQAKIVAELKEEREKIETEMQAMTARLDTTQTRLRQSEDEKRSLLAEKSKLEMAVDSVQTRSDQVEEGKRGANEENALLRNRLARAHDIFKQIETMAKKAFRVVADENAVIAPELEELKNSENSIFSSEHSQPPPTQENFIGDTQPDEPDDLEETLDQDAAVARAESTTSNRRVDPFSRSKPSIDLHEGTISVEFLDHQQQPISSISTDLSVDGTPSFEKSSLEESGLSSQSTSSKTPPAPPLQRSKPVAPPPSLRENVEESKEELDEEKKEADGDDERQDGDADGEDAEETVLPEDDADEEDKENTPVQPPSVASPEKSKSATGQQRWLQTIVADEESKNDQASEGGGVFDDETQLSGGE